MANRFKSKYVNSKLRNVEMTPTVCFANSFDTLDIVSYRYNLRSLYRIGRLHYTILARLFAKTITLFYTTVHCNAGLHSVGPHNKRARIEQ